MKNIKLLSFLMIATSLLFIQCTTDPIPGTSGVDGQDGIDGQNGLNGQDGATGTTECAECHNISTSEGVHASYLFSGHAAGAASGYAGGRSSCSRCHSNEGFIDYVTLGSTNENGYENPTAITCTTCHDMHKTFDFENEGYDYALRTLRGVDLIVDASYTINYEGTSNLCANCHQPRTATPVDSGDGTFRVTSSHWGPHHGPQATFLEGIQGAELAGAIEYPAAGSAIHRKGSSCTECHMGETTGGIDGNHTWIPTATACTSCHPNGAPEGVAGLEEEMEVLLAMLEDVGILHKDEEGEVHPVPETYSITEAHAAWITYLCMKTLVRVHIILNTPRL